MKRKIEEKLTFWLNNRNQALLISGARQIGKTYSITKFINEHFSSIIHINFATRTDLIDTFAILNNSKELNLRISALYGQFLIPGKTVIFLDEIQLVYKRREELIQLKRLSSTSQDLITAMKDLVIEGKYRYILSGSLLGVSLKGINLLPIGYMDEYVMYPLDFEEFLWAKGVGVEAIEYLKECFFDKKPVDEHINTIFLNYFREYVLVGGMPEAVKEYIKSNNLYLLKNTQDQILNKYYLDVQTYINDDSLKLRIKDIYEAIPSQLSSKNSRFKSSKVLDGNYLKNYSIQDEFLWLKSAGIVIPTYNCNEPVIPLSLSIDRKTMKLFYNDTGLLVNTLVDTGIREKLLNNEKEINYGAPYENVAAQELISHGFGSELFYYNSKSHGEVDFLITYENEVLPIEIKSGKLYQSRVYNHTALNNIIKLYNYQLAYVFGETNVVKETDVIYQMPIYMIDFLRK